MHGNELTEIAIVAVIALICGILLTRLRQPAVVGYILAGVVLGPSSLGLVENRENVNLLAELGVLMLLFLIGMELSLRAFKARLARGLARRVPAGGAGAGRYVAAVVSLRLAARARHSAGVRRGPQFDGRHHQNPGRYRRTPNGRRACRRRRADRPGPGGGADAAGDQQPGGRWRQCVGRRLCHRRRRRRAGRPCRDPQPPPKSCLAAGQLDCRQRTT